jgi:hypothetical protein
MTDVPDQPPGVFPDDRFLARADAHISLSNTQLEGTPRGEVMASMMFGTARWAAWIAAAKTGSPATLAQQRVRAIDYYVEQFRMMLETNFDDYVTNPAHVPSAPDGSGR